MRHGRARRRCHPRRPRRRRRLLARLQRALRGALRPRPGRPADGHQRRPRGVRLDDAVRPLDARAVGGDVRPALHARVRRHVGGLRPGRRSSTGRTRRPTRRRWFYGRPITLEEHQASRWIAEPLHLLDCCQETDGGQALVVVSVGARPRPAARPGLRRRRRPGRRRGPAHDDVLLPPYASPASRRWASSATSSGRSPGSRPSDMQAAVLYDHFTPFVLPQLEELGFCGRGEAGRLHRATATSSSTDRCRSTPTAASSARPTCTA